MSGEPANSDMPAATHAQSVRQSTPKRYVRVDPRPRGGAGHLCPRLAVPGHASALSPVVPTAVQLVGLKQLTP